MFRQLLPGYLMIFDLYFAVRLGTAPRSSHFGTRETSFDELRGEF